MKSTILPEFAWIFVTFWPFSYFGTSRIVPLWGLTPTYLFYYSNPCTFKHLPQGFLFLSWTINVEQNQNYQNSSQKRLRRNLCGLHESPMLWHGSEQEVKILAAECQYFHLLLSFQQFWCTTLLIFKTTGTIQSHSEIFCCNLLPQWIFKRVVRENHCKKGTNSEC